MCNGSVDAIVSGISSSTPIIVMNAILAGTQRNLHDAAFIEGVKQASGSQEKLLGIPLKSVATASLHLLGVQEYSGSDNLIWSMIDSKLKT